MRKKPKKKQNNFKKKLEEVLKRIREIKNKPQAPEIKIIAATKNQSTEKIQEAIKNGIKIIGENKIQEAEKKIKKIKAEKHFIGHLQTNKAKKAVKLFDVIQTTDTIKIIKKINETAKKINKKQKIMLQINTARDKKKQGFDPEKIFKNITEIKKLKNIIIIGIMTIAPQNKTKRELRKIFKKTKNTQEQINSQIKECKYLSMGMSGDYKEAIIEGATHIRIGTALFGNRK